MFVPGTSILTCLFPQWNLSGQQQIRWTNTGPCTRTCPNSSAPSATVLEDVPMVVEPPLGQGLPVVDLEGGHTQQVQMLMGIVSHVDTCTMALALAPL